MQSQTNNQVKEVSGTRLLGSIIDGLKLLAIRGLNVLCESPYYLIGAIQDKLGAGYPSTHFDKEGNIRYRPSRVQRFLYHRRSIIEDRMGNYFFDRGWGELSSLASLDAQISRDTRNKYDKSIKSYKWYEVVLW